MNRTKKNKQRITTLDYAILGLLIQKDQSGYLIRKTFETTAIGNYSSSPGTIYPALKRLSSKVLVEQYVPTEQTKTIYRITDLGKEALKDWLVQPITQKEVERQSNILLLKFAFMDYLVSQTEKETFLQDFIRLTEVYLKTLKTYHTEHAQTMPLHGRLAFECGISAFIAQLAWAREAYQIIKTNEHETE